MQNFVGKRKCKQNARLDARLKVNSKPGTNMSGRPGYKAILSVGRKLWRRGKETRRNRMQNLSDSDLFQDICKRFIKGEQSWDCVNVPRRRSLHSFALNIV